MKFKYDEILGEKFEIAKATVLFLEAGLPLLQWENREPIFVGGKSPTEDEIIEILKKSLAADVVIAEKPITRKRKTK